MTFIVVIATIVDAIILSLHSPSRESEKWVSLFREYGNGKVETNDIRTKIVFVRVDSLLSAVLFLSNCRIFLCTICPIVNTRTSRFAERI